MSDFTAEELTAAGLNIGSDATLEFNSGVRVAGKLIQVLHKDGKTLLLSFENCSVTFNDGNGEKILFDPSWGIYDLAIGESVPSVFGGAADRAAFGEVDDFAAKIIAPREHSPEQLKLFDLYNKVRQIRIETAATNTENEDTKKTLESIIAEQKNHSGEWLLLVEMFEIFEKLDLYTELKTEVSKRLDHFVQTKSEGHHQVRYSLSVIDELALIDP